MDIPIDLIERLRVLGHAPERYTKMVESQGVEFLRQFIEKLEETDRLFQEWEPQLREFARDCRAKSPEIDSSELRDRSRPAPQRAWRPRPTGSAQSEWRRALRVSQELGRPLARPRRSASWNDPRSKRWRSGAALNARDHAQ